MQTLTRRNAIVAAASTAAMDFRPARAETARLRVSYGYSIGYLPLMVMRDQSLLEKHAAALGLGTLQVDWQVLDGGNNINDAMLAGALDIAGIGSDQLRLIPPGADGGLDQGGQLVLLLGRIDVGVAGVVEDPEQVVQPHVHARRLHQGVVERVDAESAVGDGGANVTIGEQHATSV